MHTDTGKGLTVCTRDGADYEPKSVLLSYNSYK